MIYVFFADGFEEIEGLATVDVLRRNELEVITVGIGQSSVTGAHGITFLCDCSENEVSPNETVEAVVLPGGMPGTLNLENSEKVREFISYAAQNEKLLCAICAAPSILGHMGLLEGKKAVCFPGFEDELTGATLADAFVCRDGKIITAKGAGAAIDFATEIAAEFAGSKKAQAVKESMQCPR